MLQISRRKFQAEGRKCLKALRREYVLEAQEEGSGDSICRLRE